MADLAKLVVKLEAQTAQYQAALEKAEKRLEKFDKAAGVSAKNIATGLAVAAVAAATAFAGMAKSAIDSADHINKLSQQTGLSVENLSRMAHAADLADVDIDALAKGMAKLSKAAVDTARGGETASKAFEALGIKVQNTDGTLRSNEELILDVADRFSRLSDGATKSALAQELFSKSGAKMIPFLNQGREGINALMMEADELGLTLSTKTAQSAEEFNDNLTRIKGIAHGLANALITEALPTFEILAKNFLESAKAGGALSSAAIIMSGVFKTLVSSGVIVTSVFQQLGRIIYGVTKAQLDLLRGDFRQAGREIRDAFKDAKSNVAGDLNTIAKVWSDQVPKFEKTATEIDKSLDKTIIFSDEKAKKKAESAAEAAIKALREMSLDVQAQVETFGKGEVALIKYRVAHGDLADKIRVGGVEAEKYANIIVEQTAALEKLKTAQEVAGLNQQIQELTGHTVEAAEAAFDLSNALLKAALIDQGDEAGLKRLETLKGLIVEQEKFNALELQAEKIRDRLSETEEKISHSQEVGAISQLQAMAELGQARREAVDELGAIQEKQDAIAESSENPAIIKAAEESGRALEKLGEQTDLVGDKLRSVFEDAGGNAFASFLKGEETALGAVKGFFKDLEQQAIDFIAKDIFRQIANSVFGDGSSGAGAGGSGGGWMSTAGKFLGALFGGGGTGTTMDSGGDAIPGRAVMIGRGAQPEWFVPKSAGKFIPSGMGGNTNHISISIAAPSGTVSRQTQVETAARAARAVTLASRRNN